jgi:hypothetical protein
VVVREALMEPIRALRIATHFRRERGINPEGVEVDDMLVACRCH